MNIMIYKYFFTKGLVHEIIKKNKKIFFFFVFHVSW